MSTISALLAALLLGAPAYGAEIDWTGGNSITVNSGDTVTVKNNNWFSVNSIDVAAGGTLVIPQGINASLGLSKSEFINNGTVRVNGSLDFNPEQVAIDGNGIIEVSSPDPLYENALVLGSKELKQLLDKGSQIILGTNDAGTDPTNREHTSHIRLSSGRNENLGLDPIGLRADQFITRDSATSNKSGTILMREWGTIMTGTAPVTISGDNLRLGSIGFSMNELGKAPDNDIKESRLARLRSGNLTLVPENGNTVTLASGVLHSGRGASGQEGSTGQSSNLKIGSDGHGTLQIDGGALALGGAGNDGGEGTIEGNIIIGKSTSRTINSAMIARVGNWTMKGDLTLEKSGYLEVGREFYSETLEHEVSATLNVDGALIIKVPFFIDNANLHATYLRTDEDGVIEVRDGSSISANDFGMNGGQINFDPPFIADGDTSNASMGGLSFTSDNVDGRMNIGRNSMVTLGSTDYEWLRGQIGDYQTKTGQLWGRDITAALAVRTPQTLASNGGINVDGTWVSGGNPAAVNVARFADKSLFLVDAAGIGESAALSGNGTGTLQVESGAKLLIAGGADGDDIVVTDKFANSTIAEDGWSQNLATTTDLLDIASMETRTGKYVVHLGKGAPVRQFMPDVSPELAAIVETAVATGLDANSANAGVRFVSRAVDNRYVGANDATLAAASIESAARMAVIGAAPQMTLAANNAAGAAITQRTGLAQPDGIAQAIDANGNLIDNNAVHANSFALWIMPLYQSTNGFGMDAGNLDYDFNGALGGVALGADYTFENAIRAGISFNIGGGYAQGSGDMNKTTNNMNFWGVGAYAGWTKNNFGLSADVNFTSTYNKLKQELPQAMMMDNLKSDVTAWAISTGLRAEYKFETAALDITPHAGFRFINLNTDSYDINSGGTVVEGDSFSQNIWTFPIGVSFSKSFAMQNGWHVKPLLDVNVTPATGDIKAKTNIRFTGINQEAEIDTKMMDYVTYGGTAGIEFGNDSISFGVHYNGQFGAESSAHGVFGTFRYEF